MINTGDKNHTAKASVLVTASQGVEAHIANELKVRGFLVKVLTRNPKNLNKINSDTTEVIEGVVSMPSTLKGNLKGIHAIISTLCMPKKEKGLFDIVVAYQGILNLLNEAQKAGVKKFVHLAPTTTYLDQNPEILEVNKEFMTKLKRSGIDYTVIRLNEFFIDSTKNLISNHKSKLSLIRYKKPQIKVVFPKKIAITCADAINMPVSEIVVEGTEVLPFNKACKKTERSNLTRTSQVLKYVHGSLRYLRRGFKTL